MKLFWIIRSPDDCAHIAHDDDEFYAVIRSLREKFGFGVELEIEARFENEVTHE